VPEGLFYFIEGRENSKIAVKEEMEKLVDHRKEILN